MLLTPENPWLTAYEEAKEDQHNGNGTIAIVSPSTLDMMWKRERYWYIANISGLLKSLHFQMSDSCLRHDYFCHWVSCWICILQLFLMYQYCCLLLSGWSILLAASIHCLDCESGFFPDGHCATLCEHNCCQMYCHYQFFSLCGIHLQSWSWKERSSDDKKATTSCSVDLPS